jgi:hypothetical protein
MRETAGEKERERERACVWEEERVCVERQREVSEETVIIIVVHSSGSREKRGKEGDGVSEIHLDELIFVDGSLRVGGGPPRVATMPFLEGLENTLDSRGGQLHKIKALPPDVGIVRVDRRGVWLFHDHEAQERDHRWNPIYYLHRLEKRKREREPERERERQWQRWGAGEADHHKFRTSWGVW